MLLPSIRNVVAVALLASIAPLAPALAGETAATGDAIARFAPAGPKVTTRLDFSAWSKALHWFVLRMGPSLREYAPIPDKPSGSHAVFGHDSPYRLEGSRVAFSMMPPDMVQSLTDYREELERLPDTVPLTSLSRNEQLAYWINLHNVAVIEQIARAYPVKSPLVVQPGGSRQPLDDTPFITVAGVHLSPHDIRTRIVYPNWHDPRVIYAFWRGEIGGPSIDRDAYTATTIDKQLGDSAREFVNSLRGVQKVGDKLVVSRLYDEARPFYFSRWPNDLRAHLREFSTDEVAKLIDTSSTIETGIEEHDIADLTKGDREPFTGETVTQAGPHVDKAYTGILGRLIGERNAKLERIVREGRVIVGGSEQDSPTETEVR